MLDLLKLKYYGRLAIYKTLGVTLPKLKDQRDYWRHRGNQYMDEVLAGGYLQHEMFFQDMMIDDLRAVPFSSFFEAGCGFGWNIGRVKREFPEVRVGGVDFSFSQLENSKKYLVDTPLPVVNADNCYMPLRDNACDVGFSLGVFMNIHESKIESAIREMTRVCKRRIIHLEWDETRTTPELRKQRAFKTNIISHDYKSLYEAAGAKVTKLLTYKDFGEGYLEYQRKATDKIFQPEGFEGAEKYIYIVVDVESSDPSLSGDQK